MKTLFITIIIFCAHSIMAQTAVTKEEQTPYIEVLGSSEMEIVPDEIYVEIVIRERFDNKLKVTIDRL